MKIGIQLEDVRSKAEVFRSTGVDRYNELRQYLDNMINGELPEIWQGSGSEAYISRYQSLAPSFKAIEDLINDVAQGLIANANYYEQADADAASANNGRG
jgi:hypothetical protein